MILRLLERIRQAAAAPPVVRPRQEPALEWYVPPPPAPAEPEEGPLRHRLTIEEAEATIGACAEGISWQKLKTAMQPGDELWSFHSPSSTWKALCGRAGVVLVRDGEIQMEIVTMLN